MPEEGSPLIIFFIVSEMCRVSYVFKAVLRKSSQIIAIGGLYFMQGEDTYSSLAPILTSVNVFKSFLQLTLPGLITWST